MSIREEFNASIAARQSGSEEILAAFVKELPQKISEVMNLLKQPKTLKAVLISPGETISLSLPQPVSLSALRSYEAYRALHAYCSRPDVDIQIRRGEAPFGDWVLGPISKIEVHLSKPYKDSNDVKFMRKAQAANPTPKSFTQH